MSSRFDVSSDSEDEQELSGSASLPSEPPFTAYIHNLKAEATEKDLRHFFDEFEPIALELEEGKGEGKVEFKDRETLVRALFYSGRLLLGREVKMDTKPKGAPAKPKGAGNGAGSESAAAAAAATTGGVASSAERGGRGGGGFRGGGRGERGRGGRGEGRGARGGSVFGNSRGGRGGRGFGSGGDEGGEGVGGEGQPPEKKERPRLQLKPRSKPLEAKEAEADAARKSSIFGGGKPHDELEFTKKWREKHEADPEEQKSYSIRGDRTKARSGSFSGGDTPGRARSGSNVGAEGGRGGGAAGAAGGRGGAAGPAAGSKKPSKPKPKVGEDGWCEVEVVAGGEGKAPRVVEQETKEEDARRAVGGAFAALNLDSDSD